jgi:hypothetical protein
MCHRGRYRGHRNHPDRQRIPPQQRVDQRRLAAFRLTNDKNPEPLLPDAPLQLGHLRQQRRIDQPAQLIQHPEKAAGAVAVHRVLLQAPASADREAQRPVHLKTTRALGARPAFREVPDVLRLGGGQLQMAPTLADLTSFAYFASTPRRAGLGTGVQL